MQVIVEESLTEKETGNSFHCVWNKNWVLWSIAQGDVPKIVSRVAQFDTITVETP